MHEKLKKLLEKGQEEMHPMEQHARESVLNDLREQAHEMLGNKLKGLKKVSVMSDTPEGLEHGLSKAEELVSNEEHQEHSGKEEPKGEDLNDLGSMENPPDLDQDAEEDHKEDQEQEELEHELNPSAMTDDQDAEDGEGDQFPEHKDLEPHEIEARIKHLESLRHKGPKAPGQQY